MARYLFSALALGALLTSAAHAFMAGDPIAGRELVVRQCMACHTMPDEAASAEGDAPGFAAIAADDNIYTLRWMRGTLEESHWPGRPRSPESKLADNVIAFVLSLRNAEE